MKVVAVIPARYGSTRFPGKVLAKDTGKFLIQHTYERACLAKLPEKVIIAADDKKVVAAAKTFGAACVLTSPDHQSGTDRIAEAVADMDVEIIVNLQGDEPEIDPGNIDYLARMLMDNPDCPMATLAAKFQTAQQVSDPNIVKVIIARYASGTSHEPPPQGVPKGEPTSHETGTAIYFSRSPIPYDREKSGVGDVKQYLRHIGIYAYRKKFLLEITALPQTPLEKMEKLEQLRAIENGYEILVGKVEHTCDGIDTPEQYAEFVKRYKEGAKK
jgi:3-deoxy-manno-octulosonate cytidylyltransferase (CMP-KDO synthetase)